MEISAAQDSHVTGQAVRPLPSIPGNQVPIAGNERKPSSRSRLHSLPFCKGSFSFPEALEKNQEYPSVLLACFFLGGGKEQGTVWWQEPVWRGHDRSQAEFYTITEQSHLTLTPCGYGKDALGFSTEYLPPYCCNRRFCQRCLKFLLSPAAVLFLIALPNHLHSHYVICTLALL